MIRLTKPIPQAKAPFFAIAPAPNEDAELTLISYRRDRQHALTRQEGCDVAKIKGPVLTLGCDVTFGASGSALFQEVDGKMRIVAVLSAMSRDGGKALAYAVTVESTIVEVMARLP